MISDHLAGWDLDSFEYLFIENVGNLVCPSTFDLGEEVRGEQRVATGEPSAPNRPLPLVPR